MTLNEIVTKVGQDKVLHFLVGSLITAIFTLITGLQEANIDWSTMGAPVIGLVVTVFAAGVKEYVVDDVSDWKDFVATILGSIPIFIATVIGVLFHIASN